MSISKKRRNELKYICLAYPEKVKQIQEFSYINGAGFGQGSGNLKTDALEKKVLRLIEMKKQTELIEQCCLKVFGGDDYQEALKNITQGIPWEYLEIYMSRRKFYNLRKTFFEELDEVL
nr:hypothetical protein [uncultured Tyzzerella sp.]